MLALTLILLVVISMFGLLYFMYRHPDFSIELRERSVSEHKQKPTAH